MEMSYSDLRTKEVVNLADGRRLGKVSDLIFCYPENRIIGIAVPGCKGFGLWRGEQFIDMRNIAKIGDDVILVNCNLPPKPSGKKAGRGCNALNNCNSNNCNPNHSGNSGNCNSSGYAPAMPPPNMNSDMPPTYSARRSYEDYE